jgi:alpha-aminoadipic semialdehyde synthase
MNVLVNAIYRDTQYPKLVTVDYLKRAEAQGALALEVIGDITCDVGGSVECNVRSTGSGNPVYVYEPATDKDIDGVAGNGPVVLATDNLPCELGKESSEAFSEILVNLVPKITGADFSGTLESSGLPNEIKRSVILWKGRLTPDYTYLQEHLNEQEK